MTVLKSLEDFEDIANYLKLRPKQLEFLTRKGRDKDRYDEFTIPKKNGEQRVVRSPILLLKRVQQRVALLLQEAYLTLDKADTVHGFLKGNSIKTNALRHQQKRWVFCTDLTDFFPSINFGRVRGMFRAKPYLLSDAAATVFAQLCCAFNELPQGAPTSPIVSSMISAKMDSELRRLAKRLRCIYTRYADDLTFSTYLSVFPSGIAELGSSGSGAMAGEELQAIVHRNGFRINHTKSRIANRSRRQAVTGLTVNRRVNVPRRLIRQIRAMLHAWKKFELPLAEREHFEKYQHKRRLPAKSRPRFEEIVRGKIEFVGMIRGKDDLIYLSLLRELKQLNPRLVSAEIDFDAVFRGKSTDPALHDLIDRGENDRVEFKASLRFSLKDERILNGGELWNKLQLPVLKTIAGFCNRDGGTLLIGVNDEREVLGIGHDFDGKIGNCDTYENHLRSLVRERLGPAVGALVQVQFVRVDNGTVCRVDCKPSSSPVFLRANDAEPFFVRTGNRTEELRGRNLFEYQRTRFD